MVYFWYQAYSPWKTQAPENYVYLNQISVGGWMDELLVDQELEASAKQLEPHKNEPDTKQNNEFIKEMARI